jgi:hypothetical protein
LQGVLWEILRRVRRFYLLIKSIGEQKVDMMEPIPYAVLQSLPDALNPPHINNYWKNHYLKDLKVELVEIVRKYYYNCRCQQFPINRKVYVI